MKKSFVLLLAAIIAMSFASCTACSNISDNSSDMMSDIASDLPPISSDISDMQSDIVSDILPDESDVSGDVSGNMSGDSSNGMSGDESSTGEDSTSPTISLEFSEIAQLSNEKVTWGPGTLLNDENRPLEPCLLQDKYGDYSTYFIAPNTNKIYLTFDEGYENGYTGAILDVLKEKNVSAVFFVTMPYVKSQPELIQRMIDEGHIVGNHSNHHPSMPGLPLEEAKDECISLHEYVLETYGYEMSLFRPPQGEFSERTLALLQHLNYKNVFWSFAYNDWNVNNQPDPDVALERVVGSAHNGAIYLLHAVSETNAAILGDAIDQLRAQGYEFCTFDLQ